MPYYLVSDWRGGVDLRRNAAATEPGAVTMLENAHVTPGGDIEKRRAFVDYGTDVPGTWGVAGLEDSIFVFGKSATPPPGVTKYTSGQTLTPGALYYMELNGGSATAIQKVEDVETFDGKLYVVVKLTDDTIERFYDGTFVSGGKGTHARTYRSKMYAVETKNLHFSVVDNPTDWTGTGSGTVNLSNHDADGNRLTAIEIYYDQLALFSPFAVQFWSVDPDPAQNQQIQVLRSTGTVANHTPKQFADGDVLYLATSGVRSLRARNSSNAASVSDIGSPIDKEIQHLYATLAPGIFEEAFSLVHPLTGRFWLVINDTVFILSYFPATKVTAWSTYKPAFVPLAGAAVGQRVVLRDATKIYIYGGTNGEEYDSAQVRVRTPFFHANEPATFKNFEALDIVSENTWQIGAAFDPRQQDSFEIVGTYDGITYPQNRMAMQGYSTHVGFELINSAPGASSLSQLAFHYTPGVGL